MDRRLGSEGDVDEVLAHPWFDGFDFNELKNKKMKPDYIPKVSDDKFDVSQFDQDVTGQTPKESFVDEDTRKKIQEKINKY